MFDNQLPGVISIHRTTTSAGPDYISIVIEDKAAGVRVLDIEMSITEFGAAVTGLSAQPITYSLGRPELFGAGREHRELWISADDNPEVHETEGWRYSHGFNNIHRRSDRNGKSGYTCQFTRWVRDGVPVLP